MVFGLRNADGDELAMMERYVTMQEARAGHERIVGEVRALLIQRDLATKGANDDNAATPTG